MKRLDRGAGKSSYRTLTDRRRLQDSISWIPYDHRSVSGIDFPSITIDTKDFIDEDTWVQLLASGTRFSELENLRHSTRRFLFFFKVPRKWNDLSVPQIVWHCFTNKRNVAALISVILHIVLALILLSLVISVRVGTLGILTQGSFLSKSDELDFVEESGVLSAEDVSFELTSQPNDLDSESSMPLLLEEPTDISITNQLSEAFGARIIEEFSHVGNIASEASGGGTPFFKSVGDAANRASRKRGSQGRKGDVTRESEDAVERGLQWLARHQLPDGGWAFDLTAEDSNGRSISCRCSNSTATSGGSAYLRRLHPSRTAATAIALLPFLGSGYTHTDSNQYQKTVASGLKFLEYHATTKEDGVDFRDGFVDDGAAYIQALAVLTCCEAYEMTKDPNLKPLAEGGMRFIERSQLRDGGWRYSLVGDPAFHETVSGDLSVSGWQMLALHSGISAGFSLPVSVAYRASSFLDLVMDDHGRSYRYQPETKEDVSRRWGTSAVGVLMREYLGWVPSDNPNEKNELDRGAEQLVKWIDLADNHWQNAKKDAQGGKSANRKVAYVREGRFIYNLYFAYYASLALRNYGGQFWETSYPKIRELLISTQERSSAFFLNQCEDGSWLFYDQYMNDGGRLLNTALSILILETPYRYLPMYR